MEFTPEQIAKQCMDAINEKINNLTKLNIIVLGKSGVGKSTLINNVFREQLAKTGLGRPVTQEIRLIEKKNCPLRIYDTPGFELANEQQSKVKDAILDLIRKGAQTKDINEAIHCMWYCINVGGNRTFDDTELKWLRDFTESNEVFQIPIIVVLTQSVPKKKAAEMKSLIEKENLRIVKVVPVLAEDMDFDEEYVARSYGLDTLVKVMGEALPDELQSTFQNMQKVAIDEKKKYSHAIVAAAAATAVAEGAAPIPCADAAALIPTQVAMIAGITAAFGLEISTAFLTTFVSSTIGSAGATVLGKTVVANVLKLIPGAGTIAGGAISGTTAGLLTTALGEAYIQIMVMVAKGEINKNDLLGDKGKQIMKETFKTELSLNRK